MKNFFVSCPSCGKKRIFETKVDLNKKGNEKYLACSGCGGGILYPYPNRAKLSGIYDKSKYFNDLSKPVRNKLLQWVLTRRIFKTPAEWVFENFPKKKRVLDVGCGNGEFLYFMETHGWDVFGSDLSAEAVVRTLKLLGARKGKIKKGKFDKQKFSGKYDLISFWHVLEHLENPFGYVKKAKTLLAKNGSIVGEVPNFDSVSLRVFGPDYAWIMIPDHVRYFTPKSLSALLKRAGFVKVKCYFPKRGLLNFSISLKNYLERNNLSKGVSMLVFVLSIPFSVVFVIMSTYFDRGEVIRFSAQL